MYVRAWLVLFGLLGGFGGVQAAQTSLVFYSQNGDPGGGQQWRLTPADGSFSVSSPEASSVTLTFQNLPTVPTVWWELRLAAADGLPLTVGSYESARSADTLEPGHPSIRFIGNDWFCYTVTGRFDILELARDPQGNLIRFAAHFEQHCEGGQAMLIGEVRYDSEVPITPSIVVRNALNNQGCVMAAGPQVAPVDLQTVNADDGAGGSLLNYAWASSTGATGSGAGFQAALVLGESAAVELTVTDPAGGDVVRIGREVCVSKQTSLFFYRPGGGPDFDPDLAIRITPYDQPFDIAASPDGNTVYVTIPWSEMYPNTVRAIFAAPASAALAVGSYDSAGYPSPNASQPGLMFSPAYSIAYGRFQIRELVRDAEGKVISLAVDFEAHSLYTASVYFGQLRYNSDVPVAPVISLDSPLAEDGCVDVSTPPGPMVGLRAINGYDHLGGEQVSYRWTSSIGATATGVGFQFAGEFGTEPTVTLTVTDLLSGSETVLTRNVCIDPPSMLYLESQKGDPVGAGQIRTLWPPAPVSGYRTPFVRVATSGTDNEVFLWIGEEWSLQLGSGSFEPLAVGVYEQALGGNLNSGGAPFLAFQKTIEYVCSGFKGRFEILDIQWDADHRLTHLAVNFEQYCDGSNSGLLGQLRYKSNVPVYPNQTDLGITLAAPEQPPQIGLEGSYRLTVVNHGTVLAAETEITVSLPSVVAVAAMPSECQQTASPFLSCWLGTLEAGASAELELPLIYQAAGRGGLAATVVADIPDFDPANNDASQLVSIPIAQATIESQIADAMDPSVDPCEDFYAFACGGWIDHNQTPPDGQSYSVRGPEAASDEVRGKLYLLMQAAAEAGGLDADKRRVGSFFSACMNEAQIEQDGLAPLQPILAKIDQIASRGDFLQTAGELTRLGAPTLIAPAIGPDIRYFPTHYIFFAYAGQPGYPDGDVYRRHDRFNKRSRAALTGYIVKVLGLLGDGNPAKHARDIMRIEKTVSRFDPGYGKPGKLYVIPSDYIPRLPLKLPWTRYLQGIGLEQDTLIVVDRKYLQSIGPLLAKLPIDSLKAYLRWQAAANFGRFLPKDFRIDTSVSGITVAERPRWQVCVGETAGVLGDVVGKMLVESEAAGEQIPLAQELFDGIRQALAEQEARLPFLADPASRTSVQQKLDALITHIGFPNLWPAFSGSDASETSYLGKVLAVWQETSSRNIARIGQNVERGPWDSPTGVQTINAYNNIWTNEIYVFSGIMRTPFMDAQYPLAMNYAGLGVIVAHELVHGFDSTGRRFGANGNFDPLLSPGDNRRYNATAQCFVKQYSKYSGAEGTRVKGKKTLNENIADNGGVHLAYEAFQTALATAPAQPPVANLTPEQLFFTAYAQMYCETTTAASAYYRYSRTWNRYAPWRYRAIGPLINSPDFAEAFNCPANAPMNPEKKCSLW